MAEFDANGALLDSTYLGGKLDERVTSLAPLGDGWVAVVGYSNSNEFCSSALRLSAPRVTSACSCIQVHELAHTGRVMN